MELVVFWIIFSIVVGIAASSRGRSGVGWFLGSLIISPLLGLILVLVLPRLAVAPQSRAAMGYDAAPSPDTHVKCPDCAELVRREARVCRHCGCRLVPQDQAQPAGG